MSVPMVLALRALRDGQAASAQHLGEGVAAVRVPRREDQREHRQRPPRPGVGGEHDLLLARMGRGGEPDRPRRRGRARSAAARARRRASGAAPSLSEPSTETCAGSAPRSWSCSEARSSWARMRSKRPSSDRADAPEHPPAPEAPLRDAGVDEQHRDAAVPGLAEHRRPDLALRPHRGVGPPVVEEAPHPRDHVHRHELVDAVLRQALGDEVRRGHGDGGDEAGQRRLRLLQPAEELEQRRRLADAGGMEPDELPLGPRHRGLAHALAEALGVLLALALPPIEDAARDAAGPPGGGEVEAEQDRSRRRLAHRTPGDGTSRLQPSFSVGLAARSSSLSRCRWAMK